MQIIGGMHKPIIELTENLHTVVLVPLLNVWHYKIQVLWIWFPITIGRLGIDTIRVNCHLYSFWDSWVLILLDWEIYQNFLFRLGNFLN